MAGPSPLGITLLLSKQTQAAAAGLTRIKKWMPQAIERALEGWQLALDAQIVKQFEKGDPLKRRTGQMARSLFWAKISKIGTGFRLTLKSSLPYPMIHETGGVIRPVEKQWLTIPLKEAQTPAGVLKKRAPEWKDTFFIKSKKTGLPVLMQKRGKTKIVPLFLLVKQVEIPARRWLTRAVDATTPTMANLITQFIREQQQTGGR